MITLLSVNEVVSVKLFHSSFPLINIVQSDITLPLTSISIHWRFTTESIITVIVKYSFSNSCYILWLALASSLLGSTFPVFMASCFIQWVIICLLLFTLISKYWFHQGIPHQAESCVLLIWPYFLGECSLLFIIIIIVECCCFNTKKTFQAHLVFHLHQP